MTTALLDHWRRYGLVGNVIVCPEMTLLALDGEDPIAEGNGELLVSSASAFAYTLRAVPKDIGHVLRCVNRHRDNPYDGRLRLRLNVVDEDGLAIGAGWTIPKVEANADGDEWTFSGEVEALSFFDEGAPDQVGSDNVYLLPRDFSARLVLARFVATEDPSGERTASFNLPVLSSNVTFRFVDDADALIVSINGSKDFPQTYTENWLAEPLRVMFGQLIYPRVVARRNPDRTMIWIRPSPRWHPDSSWVALWNGSYAPSDKDRFWQTYKALLSFVARARDKAGDPNFEPNKITELYEELIQASLGSRWVWALTFASTVEGLVRMIVPRGTKHPAADSSAIADLSKHIDQWKGDAHLKKVAKSAVARTAETTVVQALRDLRAASVVTPDQVAAWEKIRNQVMHGSLVSRYSDQEEDQLLLRLAALTHALTKQVVGLLA